MLTSWTSFSPHDYMKHTLPFVTLRLVAVLTSVYSDIKTSLNASHVCVESSTH